jgi:hypothetical protein
MKNAAVGWADMAVRGESIDFQCLFFSDNTRFTIKFESIASQSNGAIDGNKELFGSWNIKENNAKRNDYDGNHDVVFH